VVNSLAILVLYVFPNDWDESGRKRVKLGVTCLGGESLGGFSSSESPSNTSLPNAVRLADTMEVSTVVTKVIYVYK
jgi:hypothetical protein